MHDSGTGRNRFRNTLAEPIDYIVHFLRFTGLRPLPSVSPPAHLTRDKALRLPEDHYARRINIHCVKRDESVDHSRTQSLTQSNILRNLTRQGRTQDGTPPPFHQKKRDANNGRIFAEQDGFWSERKVRFDYGKQLVFARHVMSRGRHRTKRRTA